MRIILTVVAALAAVTFPVYFIVFIFKSLVLGIMTIVVVTLWAVSQVVLKFSRRRTSDVKLIGR
ncbi:MAG: hypothetical protein IPQ16_11305 [Geobacteraceae bacterium]|nr:hypothetical protein [Geobacteraceae bacterium]